MGLHSSMSPKAIFNRRNRDQSSGGPISEEAKQCNSETVDLAIQQIEAFRLLAHIPNIIIDGFNDVANMTAEQEAEMNAAILAELRG
jgi:hypothetical protein